MLSRSVRASKCMVVQTRASNCPVVQMRVSEVSGSSDENFKSDR